MSYEQSKRIKPEDIAHIVNTTDSTHLRKVVIELCSMSPELSGAVARALAPKSRYAHALGMAHNPKSQTQFSRDQIRPNQMPSSGDSRTPMRHHPSMIKYEYLQRDRSTPTQNRASLPTPQSRGYSAITTPYNSSSNMSPAQSSLSRVKAESSSLSKSRELYDEELSRPGPSKPRTPQTQTPRAPVQVKPEPSSVNKANSTNMSEEPIVPQQSTMPTNGPRMCQQCFQSFTDVDDLCIWHPGSLVDEDGCKRWSCCGEVPSDLGCEFSSHIPEDSSSAG